MKTKMLCTILCLAAFIPVRAKDIVRDTTGVEKAAATSPADLLKGEVAGVRVSSIDGNPNGAVNVNIRGLNTLRGDSKPLWIVDGVVLGSSVNHNLDAFFPKGGYTIRGTEIPDYSNMSYTSPVGNFSWLNPYEIESIEVVKDLSASALYGINGANGAIIITTRKPVKGERNINWSSNLGVAFSGQESNAFKTGFNQNHTVGINGYMGPASWYNISAFFRRNESGVVNSTTSEGGITGNFETKTNDRFHFGLNTFVSYKSGRSLVGTNFVGSPSTMLMVKYPEAFPKESLTGWIDDYDDVVSDFRTVNSVWLNIIFLPGFNLKLLGGVDYQNQNRYFWYGTKTAFGKQFNGANAILNNSLFNYNAKAELAFVRNFAVKHHFEAMLDFDLVGYSNKTNDMCGTDFSMKSLRYRAISASGSTNVIQKFDRSYLQYGGFAKLLYSFDGFAGVNGSLRVDKSSRFDEGVNFFPSANAFVDLHKIFFADSKAVSSLRIDGGYGKAGHEDVLPNEYLGYWIDNLPLVDETATYYFDGRNRLMSNEWNAGLRFGFVNERFTFGVKYFEKQTEDSFDVFCNGKIVSERWVQTPYFSVIQSRSSNLANKGIEADTDLQILKIGSFKWNLCANLAYNFDRTYQLDDLDKIGTGLIMPGETRVIPSLYGGFSTGFEVIGITLEAKMSGASGFELVNMGKVFAAGRKTIEEGDFEKGDYLRLDHIALSYKIPFKTKAIKESRIGISAYNLVTFSKYSGWNPDVNSYGVNARNNGIDYSSFPVNRQIMLNINFRF